MKEFTQQEFRKLKTLKTPSKIQDFLNSIPFNFENNGENTIKSPVMVLRKWNAHCIEGAILGAYILSIHGYKPLLLHLKTNKSDFDHVITLFKQNGYWGALSKTNHSVLRYREPVYKNIRELTMSYFHEYFTNDGMKTLRSYSDPLDLNIFGKDWPYEEGDLGGIDEELDNIKHHRIVPQNTYRKLRLADKVERDAGMIVEWKARKTKK